MRHDPVGPLGVKWILERARAFRRTEYSAAGYWEEVPWFTVSQLADNFAASIGGAALSAPQVRHLIMKYDPYLWRERVCGRAGKLERRADA